MRRRSDQRQLTLHQELNAFKRVGFSYDDDPEPTWFDVEGTGPDGAPTDDALLTRAAAFAP